MPSATACARAASLPPSPVAADHHQRMPRAERRFQPGVGRQQPVGLLIGIKVAHPEQVVGREAQFFREKTGLAGRGVGMELIVLQPLVAHRQPGRGRAGKNLQNLTRGELRVGHDPLRRADAPVHDDSPVEPPGEADTVGAVKMLKREQVHDRRQAPAKRRETHGQQRRRAEPPGRRRHEEMVGDEPGAEPVVGGVAPDDLHARIVERPRLVGTGEDEPVHVGEEPQCVPHELVEERGQPRLARRVFAEDRESELQGRKGLGRADYCLDAIRWPVKCSRMRSSKAAIFTDRFSVATFRNIGTALARGFQEAGVSCDLVVINGDEQDIARYPEVNVVNLRGQPGDPLAAAAGRLPAPGAPGRAVCDALVF